MIGSGGLGAATFLCSRTPPKPITNKKVGVKLLGADHMTHIQSIEYALAVAQESMRERERARWCVYLTYKTQSRL